MKHKYNHVNLM